MSRREVDRRESKEFARAEIGVTQSQPVTNGRESVARWDEDPEDLVGRHAEALRRLAGSAGLHPGGFVWTTGGYGIGKLLSCDEGVAQVRFFHSIRDAEERGFAADEVWRASLTKQTRVYVRTDGAGNWRIGRVLERFSSDGRASYLVRFPNGLEREVAEESLEVRCLQPKSDPSEVLAAGGMETQFLHDRRADVLQTLVGFRAASRGLTALTSASVELVPYQVEVVRRVLEDPIQRYLLADEVGLGKTIEAGVIIRQCLIDHPSDLVVVLVPTPLLRQWRNELRHRFHVGEFPGRVALRSHDQLGLVPEDGCGLLVIDEAHHLVRASCDGEDVEFARLARIAHASRRLLLISATPVVGHEEATLKLLHLLDPVTHRLEDRDTFRQRVERRQEYGRRLLALDPRLPPPLLAAAIAQLRQTFPGDATVERLVGRAEKSPEDALRVVAQLRDHLTETYRLHQRVVRTRRSELRGSELLPRRSSLTLEASPDERIASVWERVEEWRHGALRAVAEVEEGERREAAEQGLAARYRLLIDALGTDVAVLGHEAERQMALAEQSPHAGFTDDADLLAAAARAARRQGDTLQIADEVSALNGGRARRDGTVNVTVAFAAQLVCLMTRAASSATGSGKVVAFSSSADVARAVRDCLARANGDQGVFCVTENLEAEEISAAVAAFEEYVGPSVLICDRSGEEGLNLQFAHGIVHLDLPLSPTRVEQRIGRLDRYGRELETIRQRFVVPSDDADSPWLAWHDMLRDDFGVFAASISEVHFVLGELEQRLQRCLFREGASGLRAEAPEVRELLKAERRRLDEQYALDRRTAAEESARSVYADLKEADERPNSLDAWLDRVLLLERSERAGSADSFAYTWGPRTQMPEWPWRVFLAPGLDRPLTYQRSTAVRHPQVALMRPGFSLLDRVERFMRWDDRGTAFATWRLEPDWPEAAVGPWTGFRLCYVVEPDLTRLRLRVGEAHQRVLLPSIRRRADAYLPPWMDVLHVGTDLHPVADAVLLAILQRPYRRITDGEVRGDFNLRSVQEVASAVGGSAELAALCAAVRRQTEDWLRRSEQFLERTAHGGQRAARELGIRNERLRRRIEAAGREGTPEDEALTHEIALNDAIVDAVSNPTVRLDAIGFFVVSSTRPPSAAS